MPSVFTYDIHRTWEENCVHGPQFADVGPVVPETPMESFLGLPVRSRLGIAAGLLLNSRWILPSSARPCYPLPNWVFVEDASPPDGPVIVTEKLPSDPAQISSSVCFGMPSIAPELWREDVRVARAGLQHGQLLIVSVVATPAESATVDVVAGDFARCAGWAAESGAHIVEANLSCPNVCSAEGTLYHDVAVSRVVVQRIRDSIGSVPLLLKVGTFASDKAMSEFLHAMNGLADGITLMNCISRPVLRHDGEPAFGPQFRTAGVLGRAIHAPSVTSVSSVREAIRRDGLGLSIAAVGGASIVQDIADFFAAGADAVLCGSSPMYLPNLAAEAKAKHPEW